jgi:hypothetical protein
MNSRQGENEAMKPAALIPPGAILPGAFTLFGAGEYSNRRAPGFSPADSHFEQHDTQDYRGKVPIVDFMQTKCPIRIHVADTI